MLRINQIPLGLDEDPEALKVKVSKILRIAITDIADLRLVKKAIDARKKQDLHFVCGVDVAVGLDSYQEVKLVGKFKNPNILLTPNLEYKLPACKQPKQYQPVVVGSGPAGLMAALILAEAGLAPIVIERGQEVAKRQKAVADFWQRGKLSPESNVQFGQGGAGAFSDGKLNTNTKDVRNYKVLSEFVDAGASSEILHLAKPHIGTDLLIQVVAKLSQKIIDLGGEFRFETKLSNLLLDGDKIKGVVVENISGGCYEIPTNHVILAIGHSARDTFEMLNGLEVPMEQKAFSLGVRIEHLQADIDSSQFGSFAGHPALGAADYKLFCHLPSGRAVYSFCMCPGGSVVAAASEVGGVVTNGMSLHSRSGQNANSALLVGVGPEDFGGTHPLAGIALQRQIESLAFVEGGKNYHAPCQLVGDFLAAKPSQKFGKVMPTYLPGVSLGQVDNCLPNFVVDSLRQGLPILGRKLKGFDHPEALLTGPETRSSSPVRINRGEDYQSFRGLYPCGEGAGYAGGIISAAVDGIRCAEAVLTNKN